MVLYRLVAHSRQLHRFSDFVILLSSDTYQSGCRLKEIRLFWADLVLFGSTSIMVCCSLGPL